MIVYSATIGLQRFMSFCLYIHEPFSCKKQEQCSLALLTPFLTPVDKECDVEEGAM